MQSDIRQLEWLALAIASICSVVSACTPPGAPARAPAPRSAGEALSHYQKEYEVGWMTPSGEISYSRVTGVALEADGNVRIDLAEPSLLWGTTGPRTMTGHWKDAGGEGELWLQFVADYSSAAGWYNNGEATPQRELWLRQVR